MAQVIGKKQSGTVGLKVPAKNGQTLKHGKPVKAPKVIVDVKAEEVKDDK